MNQLSQLRAELAAKASPKKAEASAWFFKTGPGQYGEGDKFIGLTVPEQRQVAKRYFDLPLEDVATLLASPIHEERLTALLILVHQYQKGDKDEKKLIASFYHKHRDRVNNWDLVDTTAPYILGDYLVDHSRNVLYRLAASKSLWDRRIAIISTFAFIRLGDCADSLKLAEVLLHDRHDLIQKAVGWTLREVGKKCGRDKLENFLQEHYSEMGRTALRYAIEHFEPQKRREYLKKGYKND